MSSWKPRVSVIVPTYNSASFLPQAIASIRRQQFSGIQIIVVDDGSTDHTRDAVARLGADVVYVQRANAGPSAARNAGLRRAEGDVVAFLDADDWWPGDKLQLQLPRLVEDSTVSVVSGRTQYVADPGYDTGGMILDQDDAVPHVHLGAALFRRCVFDRVGVFDESLRFSEDVDWFLRLRDHGERLLMLPEITLHYRLHGDNMTRDQRISVRCLPRVFKMSLDRRRAMGARNRPRSWYSPME